MNNYYIKFKGRNLLPAPQTPNPKPQKFLQFCDRLAKINKVGGQNSNMDNNSNLIQELLTIGLGTTAFVAEKLGEMGDRLVKEGKIEPDEAKAMVNEVLNKVNTDRSTVEDRMQQQLKTVLQDIGVPRQSEIDELRGRIDRLEHQVRDLENKQWR